MKAESGALVMDDEIELCVLGEDGGEEGVEVRDVVGEAVGEAGDFGGGTHANEIGGDAASLRGDVGGRCCARGRKRLGCRGERG